jgi:hypothetical protein
MLDRQGMVTVVHVMSISETVGVGAGCLLSGYSYQSAGLAVHTSLSLLSSYQLSLNIDVDIDM